MSTFLRAKDVDFSVVAAVGVMVVVVVEVVGSVIRRRRIGRFSDHNLFGDDVPLHDRDPVLSPYRDRPIHFPVTEEIFLFMRFCMKHFTFVFATSNMCQIYGPGGHGKRLEFVIEASYLLHSLPTTRYTFHQALLPFLGT